MQTMMKQRAPATAGKQALAQPRIAPMVGRVRNVVVAQAAPATVKVATPAISRDLVDKCINAIRFLAIDAVNKSKSGHPGMPMGCAPIGYVLWNEVMRYNPKNPSWFNRDRFVLSAGHGSMFQYSMMHLTGYESVPVRWIVARPPSFACPYCQIHGLLCDCSLTRSSSFVNGIR